MAAIPFAPERVLELGMGTGETTRRLIEAYPEAWVVGLDSSPDMVFRARKSYDDVQLARMEDPLPDGPWDLVISVLSVNQLDDEQRRNLCRRGQARTPAPWSSATSSPSDADSSRHRCEWCDGEIAWRQDDLARCPRGVLRPR